MSVKSETRIPIRIFNALASRFGAGATAKLNPEQILKIAAKNYGDGHFGDDQFLNGLDVLCHSLNTEAKLHTFGRIFSKNMILGALFSRLELSQRWQEYPEVLKAPVKSPVFIVGPARSGTTLLFNLMARDDRFRFFKAWEARRPGLPHGNQKQIKKAKKKNIVEFKLIDYIRPEFKKVHYMAPEEPEECNILLINSFEAVIFRYMFNVETYYDWYNKQDHTYTYAYYKKQLQWVQSKTPGKRWLLKSPAHLTAFKKLVEQFPDALFIQTHRDLQESIPSNCSLKYNLQSMTSYDIDKKELAEFVLNDLFRSLKATFEVRAENQLNIFDIQYRDLIQNPMSVLKQVYEFIGEDFNETAQRGALDYLVSNPKNKFGQHHYSLEEFGLDRKRILEKFNFYNQLFGYGR